MPGMRGWSDTGARLQARLEGDPKYFDAKIAGWWVWGMACWIGGGFCSGKGPWAVRKVDGTRQLVHLGDAGQGVNRQRVHLRHAGQGVNRQLVHLGNAGRGVNRKGVHLRHAGQGVNRQLVHLGDAGQGVNRQRVHLRHAGQGVNRKGVEGLIDYFGQLSDRLARVRVCCGDWSRVCTPTPTVKQGLTAVFLDPPYADTATAANRTFTVSTARASLTPSASGPSSMATTRKCGSRSAATRVSTRCPRGWTCVPWKAAGGYGLQAAGTGLANSYRERIWFSKSCLKPAAAQLSQGRASKGGRLMADTDPRLFPALPNVGGSFSSDDRAWIIKEVESGLRNHRPRLASAIENQAFYDLESERYQPRREAETEFDFAGRPRRQSGFVQQAVDRLCEHTYNPGPQRTIVGDGLADSLLTQVYETNHIDCVMQHAETQATLNDVCAIQVKATNDPDKPVDLQLWGGDEFTVFTDPEDPRQAFAVVTIDRYNQRTRYKLWFEDEVRTYLTDQYSADKTAVPGSPCRPGTGRRTPMAASRSPSFIIELRFDSSGRLDPARSCVKLNSASTIDLASLTSLS